jgi:hypothetical protein
MSNSTKRTPTNRATPTARFNLEVLSETDSPMKFVEMAKRTESVPAPQEKYATAGRLAGGTAEEAYAQGYADQAKLMAYDRVIINRMAKDRVLSTHV